MQYLTHPFTDSSGSVPILYAHEPFFLWQALLFVMHLINVVDLTNLPLYFCFSH